MCFVIRDSRHSILKWASLSLSPWFWFFSSSHASEVPSWVMQPVNVRKQIPTETLRLERSVLNHCPIWPPTPLCVVGHMNVGSLRRTGCEGRLERKCRICHGEKHFISYLPVLLWNRLSSSEHFIIQSLSPFTEECTRFNGVPWLFPLKYSWAFSSFFHAHLFLH